MIVKIIKHIYLASALSYLVPINILAPVIILPQNQ